MSMKVEYKKQFVLSIILIIFLIGSIELGARTYEYFFIPCKLVNSESLEYDYFLKKQICFDQQNLVYNNKPVLTIEPNQHLSTININSEGFRGDEIIPEQENDYKIFMIGGSTVFGAGMKNDNLTIPAQLELNLKNKFENIQVINAGVSSITSFEELYIIENKIYSMDPDMIIVYDGANDVHYKRIEMPEIKKSEEESFKFKSIQKFYRTPVMIYRYIIQPMENSNILNIQNDDFIRESEKTNSELSQILGNVWYDRINKFCEKSSEMNIKSIVIIQPTIYNANKPISISEEPFFYKNPFGEETFKEIVENSKKLSNCTLVKDYTNIFDDSNESLFYDSVHLNDKGNSLIAQKIYDEIFPTISADILNNNMQ